MNPSFENVKLLQCLTKHTSDVTCCDFAPNFVLVTCSSDKTVRVWDWISGSGYVERSCSPFRGHKYAVTCVKVSPQGCILASSSVDGTTVLWNMHSGTKIQALVQINGDAVRVCRFSNDSGILITAGDNGAICVWDLIHRSLIRTVLDHEGAIQSLAFTPDSHYLLSTCSLEKIKIWCTQHLVDSTEDVCSPLCCVDNAHDLGILYIDVSNIVTIDGDNPLIKYYTFATSGNNKKIKIWKIKSHTLPKCDNSINFVTIENINVYFGHESAITCVKFNNNGNFLISCSMDRTIKIWDSSGTCINTLREHSRYINCVALSKDCSLIASGSNDKSILIWDTNGNLEIDSELIKPSALLASTFFNQVNEFHVAQNLEDTFKLIEKLDDIAEASINSCHFSVDNILATGASDKQVKLFKIFENGNIEELSDSQLKGHTYSVNHVVFSRSGKMLATCSLDGCAIIWEPLTGEKIAEMPQNDLAIRDCRFSNNEKLLVTVGDDERAYIWDINSTEIIINVEAHSDAVTSACFTPDDKIFVTVCANGEFKLWSSMDGNNIHVEYYAHDLGIQFCDLSENLEPIPLMTSNGKQNYLLATCGNDSLVKLWTIIYTKRKQSVKVKNWRTFVGHGGNVTCVRFSPKLAELVCSTATDRQLRIWSVYSGGCVQVLNHDSIVTSCSLNANCSLLSASCLDRSLWLWKLPENLTVELSFTQKINSRKKVLGEWCTEDVMEWLENTGFTDLTSKASDCGMNGQQILTMAEGEICEKLELGEEQASRLTQELKWLKKIEFSGSNGYLNCDLLNVPDKFLCPITQEIMREPVICADGSTYEKQAITEWFMSGKFTSPLTNESLPNADYTVNYELRNEIREYLYKEHDT